MTERDQDASAVAAVLDNPAGRLQFWLDQGRTQAAAAARDQAVAQSQNRPRKLPFRVLDTWCAIWELNADVHTDRIEFAKRAAGMIDAAAEVRRRATESTNYMAPTALEHFNEVEGALVYFMHASSDIGLMMDKLTATGWHSLKMLDSLLSNETPEPSLSGAKVSELAQQTNDLIAAVAGATDLSEDDRLVLVEKLNEIATALRRAQITGTTDIVSAADGLIGGLMRLHLRGVDVMNHPVSKAAWALAGAIFAAVGIGASVSEIAGGPFAAVLGLPSPSNDTP